MLIISESNLPIRCGWISNKFVLKPTDEIFTKFDNIDWLYNDTMNGDYNVAAKERVEDIGRLRTSKKFFTNEDIDWHYEAHWMTVQFGWVQFNSIPGSSAYS